MSKPSVSQHLTVLENAGLIAKEKRGQFVHYTIVTNNLINTLNGHVFPVPTRDRKPCFGARLVTFG